MWHSALIWFDRSGAQKKQTEISWKRRGKRWLAATLLLLAIMVIYGTPLHTLIGDLAALRRLLGGMGFIYGAITYLVIFVIASLMLFPGSILVIAAAMLFGIGWGTLLSLLAATLASSCAFLLARYLGQGWLQALFGQRPVFRRIMQGMRHHGIDFLIFTRLVPLFPYNIQNYAYGLTNIGFWRYTLISALTLLPGTFIYSYMAATLAQHGITWQVSAELLLCGLVLFVISQGARRIYRRCLLRVSHDVQDTADR